MITHIVLWKLRDPNPETKARVMAAVRGMAGRIPGLLELEVGEDVVRSARSYDLALIARFPSLSALEAYQVHPVHVEVSNFLSTVRESVITVDFETEEGEIEKA